MLNFHNMLMIVYGPVLFVFQLLNLLDVIIDNAESRQGLVEHGESLTEEPAQMSTLDADTNAGAVGSTSASGSDAKPSKVDDASKPSSSGANGENESHNILLNLPQAELRLLCSLLACERYGTFESVLHFNLLIFILAHSIAAFSVSSFLFALATCICIIVVLKLVHRFLLRRHKRWMFFIDFLSVFCFS